MLTVAIVNLAIGPRTFRPSIFGKIATATYIVTAVVAMFFNYLGYHSLVVDVVRLRVAGDHARLGPALHLARGADHRALDDMPRRHERREPRHHEGTNRHRRLRAFAFAWLLSRRVFVGTCVTRSPPEAGGRRDVRRHVRHRSRRPRRRPNQVAYFTKLAQEGGYDGTIFHRVVKYGMVQGGDPLSKDPAKRSLYGTGGLNAVKAEARAPKMTRGSVAAVLVPGRPDSAGAQFFVVLVDQPALDGQYTVFGQVSDGMEVLQKISETPVDATGLATDRVEIRRVTIRDTPAGAVLDRVGRSSWPATARCSTPARARSRSSSSPTRRPRPSASSCGWPSRRLQRHGVPPRRAGLRDSDRRAQDAAGAAHREAAEARAATCRRSSTTPST